MSPCRLRPATGADFPQMAAIFSRTATTPATADDFARLAERWAKSGPVRWLLAEDEAGHVHGYGSLSVDAWRSAGTFSLHVSVDPDAAGQGLGGLLHAALTEAALRLGARLAVASVRDDRPEWLAWAQRRGYVVTNQYFKSELDLATFDPAPFRPAVARARAAGYRFLTLNDVEQEEGKRRLYEVDMDAARDEPGIETTTWPPISFEEYAAQMFQPPLFDPGAVVIAEQAGEWAGFTGLHYRPQNNSAWVSFTGVRRAHRGQGLAQALKLLSAEYAMSKGWAKIGTSNNALNPAMLAVNRKLGFVPLPGMFVVERVLERDI